MVLGFDRSGSYGSVLVSFFLATLFAVVLMTKLGPYRFRPGIKQNHTTGVSQKSEHCSSRFEPTPYNSRVPNALAFLFLYVRGFAPQVKVNQHGRFASTEAWVTNAQRRLPRYSPEARRGARGPEIAGRSEWGPT
jgi:hypothetical protein